MLADLQVLISREQMEAMAGADARGNTCSFSEDPSAFDTPGNAARRRRMEIRRFKLIANSGSGVEPSKKRSRRGSDRSYACCSVGEGGSMRKRESRFVLRHPVDNDESRNDGQSRRPLTCEDGETLKRLGSSNPTPNWEGPAGVVSMQNSSSGEEESGSSGTCSTSSSSSSVSSDSTSTSLESNEVDGGSSVTWTAEPGDGVANFVESPAEKVTTSGSPLSMEVVDPAPLVKQDRSLHQAKQQRPPGRPNVVAGRDQSDPSASSSGTSALISPYIQCPPHGKVSVCGRRREMEDAVASIPSFVSLPCDEVGGNLRGSGVHSFHFFGVYDGHGGSQAALYCADRLHHMVADEMRGVLNARNSATEAETESWDLQWQKALSASFLRIDAEVGGICWRGDQCGVPEGTVKCCAEPVAPESVGSTAVVAVVSSTHLIVANCGDSRAVLSRGGQAIPLSVDHKPEREDEMARVEAAGGRVIYWDGYRVLGVLAMSRAIGDRYLKPSVIPDPEFTCTPRTEEDECLILASDGLWDVLKNDVVCDIARKCLTGQRKNSRRRAALANRTEEAEESPAAAAAALLTKLALARNSSDNISVVVVDLRNGANG